MYHGEYGVRIVRKVQNMHPPARDIMQSTSPRYEQFFQPPAAAYSLHSLTVTHDLMSHPLPKSSIYSPSPKKKASSVRFGCPPGPPFSRQAVIAGGSEIAQRMLETKGSVWFRIYVYYLKERMLSLHPTSIH